MPDWLAFLIPSLHLAELFLRGSVTYLGLAVLLRLVGRREAGGLGLTDLLVVLLAVDAASTGLTGEASTLGDSFVLVCTVLIWSVGVDYLSYRWPRFGRLFKASPRPLIRGGKLDRRAMRRELMSDEEVISQLRLHGIEAIDRVERAYIEPNGMVSVVLRAPEEPVDSRPHPGI
jgi:uncharacterized membrane protein YcaP (DUF421 family)